MGIRRSLLLLAVALLFGYLAFAPVPIEPVAWTAARAPGYVPPHAPNERLAGLEELALGGAIGPEHIAVGRDGTLYTAVLSGDLLRLGQDGSRLEILANTGGRPLGLDFDAAERLIVADSYRGLLALEPDHSIEVLADQVDGDPIRYADAVVVAKDGRIYLSDASRRFAAREWGSFDAALLDLLEHSCSGRVIEYDPTAQRTRVLIGELCFANGLALSADQRSLFVAETGEYRVWKVDLRADGLRARAILRSEGDPFARVLLDNLPGFPDNLMRGHDGRIWLGFTRPRSAAVDAMAGLPFLRALTMRLPRRLWPVPPSYGHVIAFTEDGRIVADLQDPGGRLPDTTGVTETAERLYIQTLHGSAIGVLDKRSAGID